MRIRADPDPKHWALKPEIPFTQTGVLPVEEGCSRLCKIETEYCKIKITASKYCMSYFPCQLKHFLYSNSHVLLYFYNELW